jgi:hypothetical protein
MQQIFNLMACFLERARELRINILRRKKGVKSPDDTIRGLYHALTKVT